MFSLPISVIPVRVFPADSAIFAGVRMKEHAWSRLMEQVIESSFVPKSGLFLIMPFSTMNALTVLYPQY